MLSIRLDKNMEKSLEDIANITQESKSTLIREALAQYIEDKFLQYLVAIPRQRFRCRKAFSTNLLIL